MVIELICLIAGGVGTYLLMLPDYAAERKDIQKNHEAINARQMQAQLDNEQAWQRIRAQTEHTLSWMQSAFVMVRRYCAEAVDGMADMLRNIAGIDTQLQQTKQNLDSTARTEELLCTGTTDLINSISELEKELQAAQAQVIDSEPVCLLPEIRRLQKENQNLQQALVMAHSLIEQLQEALATQQPGPELLLDSVENVDSDALDRPHPPGVGSYG